MTSLTVSNLHVSLSGRKIVRDISLEVSTGQWLCIIGPNGAGKSTLLRAIAGLVESQGDIHIKHDDVDTNAKRLKERDRACWIAYVAQDPVMPAGMRVYDYVMLGRTAHLRLLASETDRDHDITQMVLGELDLVGLAKRDVATLSGGERQRAAIARALAQASPMVLLDEPTTALDIGYQQEVLELIDQLRRDQRIAVISTMHDLTVSGLYPDRLMLLSQGAVVAHGSAQQVLTEELISHTYGARVRIINDKEGIIVVPERSTP